MLDKENFTKNLAQKLKKMREAKGVSQEELSHKAKLYRTYIGHIENGRYLPSSFVVYKIATALGVEVKDLFPN